MPPPDFTDRYNTQLSPEEEAKFQEWAKANHREGDVADYDLRGAWKANASEASNGHLPDTWKKPNHPTFSDESVYNGADGVRGGKWIEGKDGKWSFVAGPANVRNMGEEQLRAYFREREPDATLVVPPVHDRIYGKPEGK